MRFKVSVIFLIASALLIKSCSKDPLLTNGADSKPIPVVLDRTAAYPPFLLPSDNPLTEEGILLGRMLFYDPIMSKDSSISCASCHKQEFAFTDGAKTSKGIRGQILGRNSMPLYNLMWNKRFFWDGRATSLKEQVLIPIQAHNEMDMNLYDLVQIFKKSPRYAPMFKKAFGEDNVNPVTISKALEQFLVSMVSFNAPIDQLKFRTDTLNVISASALRGLKLFLQPIEQGGADCFHCHSNMPFFGNNSFSGSLANNGLDMVFTDKGLGSVSGLEGDNGKFKIPSLRNVEVSAPYMHDGRFDNLEEVMDFYGSGIKLNSPNLDINILSHNAQLNLSTQQKEDIIAFLKTLTDQSFLTNPKFKSPF